MPLTLGNFKRQTKDYPDDAEIVITLERDSEATHFVTFYAHPDIGHGWKPSNIIELTLGEFAAE